MLQKERKNKKQLTENLNNYARYSGMAFQMIAILLLGVFGGIKLDKLIQSNFPIFLVVFSLLAVILSIYLGLKDFLRIKKE